MQTKDLNEFDEVEVGAGDNFICARGRVSAAALKAFAVAEVSADLTALAARVPAEPNRFSLLKMDVSGGAAGEYCYVGVKKKNGVYVLAVYSKEEIEE